MQVGMEEVLVIIYYRSVERGELREEGFDKGMRNENTGELIGEVDGVIYSRQDWGALLKGS